MIGDISKHLYSFTVERTKRRACISVVARFHHSFFDNNPAHSMRYSELQTELTSMEWRKLSLVTHNARVVCLPPTCQLQTARARLRCSFVTDEAYLVLMRRHGFFCVGGKGAFSRRPCSALLAFSHSQTLNYTRRRHKRSTL